MKNEKPKTALSKTFSRVETLIRAWQNLTWSGKIGVYQYALIFLGAVALAFCFAFDHIISGGAGLGLIISAVLLEFLID